jgi:predicted dehydrogenase
MLTLRFPSNAIGFSYVSWLGGLKTRRATIVGSKKTLLFDDAAVHDNIRLYDRVAAPNPLDADYGKFRRSERQKEIAPARLQESRPLDVECRHFVDCVLTGSTPQTDGFSALRAVSILEAANRSLRHRGAMVPVRPADV